MERDVTCPESGSAAVVDDDLEYVDFLFRLVGKGRLPARAQPEGKIWYYGIYQVRRQLL